MDLHEIETILADDATLEGMDPDDVEALREQLGEIKRQHEDRLNTLGTTLQRRADEQVRDRQALEDRWIEDLRQYAGQYDTATLSAIKQRKGSQVFVNITRHKANTAEARLADMLFPTDDKNWGIKPTPVPTTTKSHSTTRTDSGVYGQPGAGAPDIPSIKARNEQEMNSAIERARLMETEIDDQLNESGYNAEARLAIHDAVVLGTGVIKGPVIEGRYKKAWEAENGNYTLSVQEILTPCARHVSLWDFFPDMSATRTDEAEFFFERHYFTKRELADLAQIPGFDEMAIREVIAGSSEKARSTNDRHISELRALSGYTSEISNENRYEVWEYTGSLEQEVFDAAGVEYEEEDLYEPHGTVWFCNGKVLRVSVNPMATKDAPYSVFCFQEDDTSIFGVGVPYLMRNAQAAINSAWRMIMDNSGLSSGPQIIINKGLVRPEDGDWTLTPRKLWTMADKNRSVHEVFGSYNVESHQAELASIFQIARQLADEETSIPLIAQGEMGNVQQTASGMSMLMNNANIVLRRSVKVWDDNVTRKLIQRFYDWNMQFNEKPEIKGDFHIDARGSSVLMAREVQMQSMAGLMQISQSPAFAPMTDFESLYKMMLRQMQMPVGDVMLSKEEIQKRQQAQAQNQQQGDPKLQIEQAKLQFEQQKFQVEMQNDQAALQIKANAAQVEMQRAQLMYEAEMAKIANQHNISLQQLQAQMGLKQMQIESDEKQMAFEAKVKMSEGSGL